MTLILNKKHRFDARMFRCNSGWGEYFSERHNFVFLRNDFALIIIGHAFAENRVTDFSRVSGRLQ